MKKKFVVQYEGIFRCEREFEAKSKAEAMIMAKELSGKDLDDVVSNLKYSKGSLEVSDIWEE